MPEPTERPSKAAAIETCTLFNALTVEEKQTLVEGTFLAYAPRGETIWMAGAPSDYSAVVVTGFVKLTQTTPTGQEVAMELLGPGQAFGVLVAIEGRPFPLSAIAITSCWYLKIPTPVLMSIFRESNPFKEQIIRNLGPRLRRAHAMMSRLSTGSAEERIAAILFILADSYGLHEDATIRITVPLTRQEIGEMAGTTVETTIRVMSKWQKDGLLHTDRHVLTILDSHAFEKILNH
jgi:CRP/FNR family transcriptional regulator